MATDRCNFVAAFRGRCPNDAVCDGLCKEHMNNTCVSCGELATHDCPETFQFVCGAPLCDGCAHTGPGSVHSHDKIINDQGDEV